MYCKKTEQTATGWVPVVHHRLLQNVAGNPLWKKVYPCPTVCEQVPLVAPRRAQKFQRSAHKDKAGGKVSSIFLSLS